MCRQKEKGRKTGDLTSLAYEFSYKLKKSDNFLLNDLRIKYLTKRIIWILKFAIKCLMKLIPSSGTRIRKKCVNLY